MPRRIGLPFAPRCDARPWAAQHRHGRKWQWQVEPVSGVALAFGCCAGARHCLVGCGRRIGVHTLGRTREDQPRDANWGRAGSGHCSTRTGQLKLGFASDDFGYAIDLGLPIPSRTRFSHDPEIKAEAVWTGPVLGRANLFADRRGQLVRVRSSETGGWRDGVKNLSAVDSMIAHCADPADGLELLILRERMRAWRFYDDLRTDRDAPARRSQVGTFTPILAGDGSDIGAAIQTIIEIGDSDALRDAIADAFDGATIGVGDRFEVEMRQHGLLRSLTAAELSDGTLRYVLLVASLLSPRPPELMILNEPEASLHPDLLNPLARLLVKASERCQIVVVSHAQKLVAALGEHGNATLIELQKSMGETIVAGAARPDWKWPSR